MNKIILLFTFVFLSLTGVYGQNLVYLGSLDNENLYLVNLDDCSVKEIGEMPEVMYDIAMSPSGELYGISGSSLYKIDANTGKGKFISNTPALLNALVYGANDSLYAASVYGEMYRIDRTSGNSTYLGNCRYSSGGDLTFYNGTLYLAGSGGEVVKINLPKVSQSTVVGYMGLGNIKGMITVGSIDCNGAQAKIYATGGNIIYDLDINTGKVKEKCRLNIRDISGAASLVESSKVVRKNAGKDSTIAICSGLQTPIDLQQYLPNIEIRGTWKDLDRANSLTKNVINTRNLAKGTYRFQYILGENICADTSQVTINIASPVIVSKIDIVRPSCGAASGSILVSITDTTVNTYTYSINNKPSQKANKFLGLGAGSFLITATRQDKCKSDTTIVLPVIDMVNISNTTIRPTVCGNNNGSLTIVASGGTGDLSYSVDAVSYQEQSTFSNLVAGDYNITAKDQKGCISRSVKINVPSSTIIKIESIEVKQPTCNNDNGSISVIAIDGKSPIRYSIDSTTFQVLNQFANLKESKYKVLVQDADGCTVSQVLIVERAMLPKILSIRQDSTECAGEQGSLSIEATGVGGLTYSIDSLRYQTEPVIRNLTAKEYVVYVRDVNDCVVREKSEVFERCLEMFYVPSAFSPNRNGLNDTWVIRTLLRNATLLTLKVFNRWGEVIYEAINTEIKSGHELWDGKSNNQSVQSGMYTYTLIIQYNKTFIHRQAGKVMVLQ